MKKQFVKALIGMALMTALTACGASGAAGGSSAAATTQAQTAAEAPAAATQAQTTAEAPTAATEAQAAATEAAGDAGTTQAPDAGNAGGALVVYFSRAGEQYTVGVIEKGNTAIVAEMIAEETGADLFEVLPQEDYYPYTYDALLDVARQEQNDNARPAYQGTVPDLSAYSTVFIGAPVWWGDWPMIMYTFFEENKDALAGKTLIPFSTHEGSGLSGFDRKLAGACPDATVGEGLAVRGNDAQNSQDSVRSSVTEWLSGLGF